MKNGVLAEPVLVGRERELTELMRHLDLAFERKGATVFISGEAGSGKTRLVNEFLNIVKEKDIIVLSSWCLSDVAVPYFPFMEAFNAYFSTIKDEGKNHLLYQSAGILVGQKNPEEPEDEESEIKRWLNGPKQAEKSGKLQNLTPQGWKDLAVAAVTKALLSISAKKTLILFIDDLQWADSASLSLLHYISRSIGSARILVLATYRTEELSPDSEGRPHPLVETLRLMRREDMLNEVKLSNLDQSNVVALAEKMVGGSLHSELTEKLAAESKGNPLFVVESLRMLSEHGSLVQDSGRWRLSIDEVGIPAKIKDIILRRLNMLKPNQRRLLDLASVIGDRFDVELLGAVISQDSLEVLETLNAIGQSSSLVCCEGSFYEFDHGKSREAIYEEISPPLKKGYHERIAEKLEAKGKNSKDLPVNDLAYHYARAGNKEKTIEFALAAGEDALARFSNAEAIKHYALVIDATPDASKFVSERTKALEGLGDVLSTIGLFAEALNVFEQLISVAESGVVKLRAIQKALGCSYWVADPAHSLELISKAQEYAQLDRLEYARFRLNRGFIAHSMGKFEQAFEDIEGALRIFEEEYSVRDVARALSEMVFFYLEEDRVQDELAAGLRSVILYEELDDLRGQLWARNHLGWALRQPELYEEALDNAEKSVRIGEKIGDYNSLALALWGSAIIHGLKDDYGAAIAECLKAAEYAGRTNAYVTQRNCYGLIVRNYAKSGEVERAEEFVKKIEQLLDKAVGADRVVFSKALFLTAKGQWKQANDIFEKFFEKRDKNPWGSGPERDHRGDYAWALAKQGRTEEAKTQLEIAKKLREKVEVELKRLEHANLQAHLMVRREIGVGEELNIRLDLVNVAKNPALLIRVEGLIPSGFSLSTFPSYCNVQDGSLEMKQKRLNAFGVEPVKLSLHATKAGVFTIGPQVVYIDDKGEIKTHKSRSVTLAVRPMLHTKIGEETISVPILPGRVATGFRELDVLLFGGIPENSTVVLTSPPSDEVEVLIKKYLETGIKTGETTFHITAEAGNAKTLAESYPSCFFLFICNSQADTMIQNLPNVFKLKGIENLTEIDIALTKAFRMLDPSRTGSKRICIEIISDALLHHHAVTTRRWLSALLPTFKSKGFSTLAVVNPRMHPIEDLEAILGIFDGEIRVIEKETPQGTKRTLKIRRLHNQKYLENEVVLSKEKISE